MDEKLLQNAQYRKAAPMAFLNSRNTAMEMVKMEGKKTDLLKRVKKYTNNLMKDYQEFYSKEVASVGGNYNSKDSIARLKKAKNLEELQSAWVLLSADERKDGDVRKVAQELKAKYKNEKA